MSSEVFRLTLGLFSLDSIIRVLSSDRVDFVLKEV